MVNSMTYSQFGHVVAAYLKDKMFVVSTVAAGLGDGKKSGKAPRRAGKNTVPNWMRAKMRPGANVVDLDGPLENLRPFVAGIDAAKK